MTIGYNTQHTPTKSSKIVAEGPGVVDFKENENWQINYRKTVYKLTYETKRDLEKMFNNVQIAFLEYSRVAMKYRNSEHPLVIQANVEYQEAKDFLDHNMTLAILSGHVNV